MAAQNAIVSGLLNFRIRMFVKSAVIRGFKIRTLTWLFVYKVFQWFHVFLPAMESLCVNEKQRLIYIIFKDLFS